MTYYLRPPEGVISANLYQSYAECRLKYLATLRQLPSPSTTDGFNGSDREIISSLSWLAHADCVIEGSPKDRVSHFALRSISILDPTLHKFVLHKEQILFRKRMAKMEYEELKLSIMCLLKQVIEYRRFEDNHAIFFLETELILREILKKRHLRHCVRLKENVYYDKCTICPSADFSLLILAVPFNHVLPLMAKREVKLEYGNARLRCDQIPIYLTLLFTKLLEYSSQKIILTGCLQKIRGDTRLLEVFPRLMQTFNIAVPVPPIIFGSNSRLTVETLDELSSYFPPCMAALHRTVRSSHRLCHKPRIQYTLFLKDIGLPVDECIKLIRTEYSRPAAQTGNQKHKCEHSWNQDSRKYTYGTRHLYGLEGSRTEYSSHSCHTIQKNSPGPNECGGCPFVHYDDKSLTKFLAIDLKCPERSKGFISRIKSANLLPIESCHFHLRFKSKNVITETKTGLSQNLKALENSQVAIHNVFKPKHYFALMSKVTGQKS